MGDRDAASRLIEHKERILAEWEDQVRERVVPARHADRPALRNSLPEVLDGMAATLRHADPELALRDEEERLAVGHGRHRAQNPDYSLDQVIGEYHVLRRVLFDVLEEGGQELSRSERDILWDVIFIAIKNAAAEFKTARDEQSQELQRRIDRANLALADALGAKSAEATLKQQLLTTIFERVEDYAIFALDAHGRVSTWAKGAEKMKRYAASEVIGRHYSMLYPEEGRVRNDPDNHLKTAATEGRFRGEGLRRRKNGELFLADVLIVPMYEGDSLIGYFKIVTDLTERNRIIQERDLTRTRVETLELESELRERFVFTLSHDLRSPLSAAMMSAHIIAKKSCEVDKHRDLAERAIRNLARVDAMIGDLLDASRIKAGQAFVPKIDECDICEIVRDVHEEFGTIHGDRFRVKAPASLVGFWDAQGMRRVIENLVTNAIKYGDPLKAVTISVAEAETRVLLKVHNFGSTIASSDQESLFELFRRADAAEKGPTQGWGLGLTLVRGITEAHGGVVKVRSLSKEGTTFVLDLPRDARGAQSGVS